MKKHEKLILEKILGMSYEDACILAEAEKEYQKLLDEEKEEVYRYAAAHGWKSTRAERGTELRAMINELSSKRKTP